jgi:hypothetical protein
MKNSLLFLKELCSYERPEREIMGPFVRIVMPMALIKTTYEKNFIVSEAKQCFTNAVKNLAVPELIDTFVEGCKAKNNTLAEYSIGSLAELVRKFESDYFLSESESAIALHQVLIQEAEGKRMKMKKNAETIL